VDNVVAVARGVWRFGVLGPFVVERDGVAVPFTGGRQRALLAVLLAAGEVPMSRDRLIDELWGERVLADAGSTLHVHLSKLRERLGELLVREPAGYRLAADGFTLDASEFEVLIARAQADSEQAGALLGRALELFRGDPLCDVPSDGIVGQWRRELEEKRLAALVGRIDAELAVGAGRELVSELERLAGAHRFEERVWGQLMLALYRADRQADALEAFGRARRLFASELGLTPGEPLSRLHQQILDHDPCLLPAPAPAVAVPPPPARPSRSGVPLGATPLVGREHELDILRAALADPDVRVLTITGPGGVGKTRLALELAGEQESSFADGALFVRLERVTDPALIATEIATALARRDAATGPGPDELYDSLRDRELLLVLDNFEHLLDGAPLVGELLADARRLRVVLTSRAALRVRGEHVFELEPLPVPAGEDDPAASPAVVLFLQCALAADRRLRIDTELIGTVGRICRALDGLPLAIELAACRCGTLSPAMIAGQLSRPLEIGEHGLRDLPERQQTLRSTIAWSYELLSAEARVAFRAAGVFLGGFSGEALAAVLEHPVADALGELQQASLVRCGRSGRYELLELVRVFAVGLLTDAGDADALGAAHRRYYAGLLAPVGAAFGSGAASGDLAAPLWPEHPNIRAALRDAIDRGDRNSAAVLALGLRALWNHGNLRHESGEFVAMLLARFTLDPGDELELLRMMAGIEQATDAWQRRFAERAAALGDREQLGLATVHLAMRSINERDFDQLGRLRPTLGELVLSDITPRVRAWVYYVLSTDAYIAGRYAEALEHAVVTATLADELGIEYMSLCAAQGALLARSALDGVLAPDAVLDVLARSRSHGADSVVVIALWFAARYAAGIDPTLAGRWLALAEHMLRDLVEELFPECALRDEALHELGIADLAGLIAVTPALDATAAIGEALAWMSRRDPAETASRTVVPVSIDGHAEPIG
jgi:predicted ATPase/DNA-binding SARP family transcriptional activator